MCHLYHWGKGGRENRNGAPAERDEVRNVDRIGCEIGTAGEVLPRWGLAVLYPYLERGTRIATT